MLFFATHRDFDGPQRTALCDCREQLGSGLRTAQRADAEGSWEPDDPSVAEGARVALHVVPSELAEVAGARHFLESTPRTVTGPGPHGNREPDPLAVPGRGLQVVETPADRWGSELSSGGTTVSSVLDA